MPVSHMTTSRDDLVAMIYEIAANPHSFGDFLTVWDGVLNQLADADGDDQLDTFLADHIVRAERIMTRFERTPRDRLPPPLAQGIELDQNPAVLISTRGQVIAANAAALQQTPDGTLQAVQEALRADPVGAARIDTLIRGPFDGDTPVLGLVRLGFPDPALMVLTHAGCPHNPQVAGLLSVRRPVWAARTSDLVQEFFHLTQAETDIVQDLVLGASVHDIATRRARSVHTIRTQIKSILAKTGYTSQLDLIRNLGFLHPPETTDPAPSKAVFARWHELSLKDGRLLRFKMIGPDTGRPVLFLHGLIDSLDMIPATEAALLRHNIRLIAPVRPHFGKADPVPRRGDPLDVTITDCVALLNHLGLETVPVLGHMAGTFYGFVLADRHPDRVSGLCSVAGAVPMVQSWQISGMSRGHRISARAARHAPALLPIMIMGGIQRLRSQGEEAMFNLYHSDGGLDKEHSHAPDILPLLLKRFEFATMQGYRAFYNDILRVSSDWSALTARVRCPVLFCHGAQDNVVLIDGVRRFASTLLQARLCILDTAGQLIWTQEPDQVLTSVADFTDGLCDDLTSKRSS